MAVQERIIRRRAKTIRRAMAAAGVDCLIVTRPANVTYLTGFLGDDSWVVVAPRSVYLVTDSRYTEQAGSECIGCCIFERKGTLADAVAAIVKRTRARMIGIEQSVSLAEFRATRKALGERLKGVCGMVESARSIKDAGEVALVRTAARMAAKALGAAVRQIKRGMTETELAGILDLEMRRCGGQAAFETIVAFGANGSRPHHRPGTKRLRENDAILIDFGVRYNGYCCDITRCLVAGRPNRFYKRVYAAVKEAQDAAIAEIAGGVDARKVDRAARDVLRREDLPVYGHGTGHGLGLEVHEHPRLHEKSTDKLRTGEVVTVEPAVYIPGWSGIRIEDDVLVTDHGCEILTRDCPYQF